MHETVGFEVKNEESWTVRKRCICMFIAFSTLLEMANVLSFCICCLGMDCILNESTINPHTKHLQLLPPSMALISLMDSFPRQIAFAGG